MALRGDFEQLTEEVKQLARRHGAALVGVANIERFDPMPPFYDRAPKGHDPRDFLSTAKAVISIAQPVLNPVMDAPAFLADNEFEMVPQDIKYEYLDMLYNETGHVVQDYMLVFISQMIGQYLLKNGYQAMIFPTTGLHPKKDGMTDIQIWEGPSKQWQEKHSPFGYTFGPFSHRHAATRAGLGEFGYNNIVLTKEFGSRQRFNSIITDAALLPDPLITEPICLRDNCNLCLKACVMDAITFRDDKNVKDYRSIDVVDKNQIFIDTPCKTDPKLCRRRRERIPGSPVRGDCARVCPLPLPSEFLTERLKGIVNESKK